MQPFICVTIGRTVAYTYPKSSSRPLMIDDQHSGSAPNKLGIPRAPLHTERLCKLFDLCSPKYVVWHVPRSSSIAAPTPQHRHLRLVLPKLINTSPRWLLYSTVIECTHSQTAGRSAAVKTSDSDYTLNSARPAPQEEYCTLYQAPRRLHHWSSHPQQ